MNATGTEETQEVVSAAPEPVVEPTAEVKTETEKSQERDEGGKFRKPVQPRIDELTRNWREEQREKEYWRGIATAKQTQETAKAAVKPEVANFSTYDEYVEALTDWKADQKIDAKLGERDKQAAEKTAAETQKTRWAKAMAEAAKSVPDISERLANSSVRLAKHVSAELLESDIAPHLALHLDQHPDIADRLNGLPANAAARELGRIEAQIQASMSSSAESSPEEVAEPVTTPARQTKAPAPAKPLSSGRSTTADLSKQSMDDYVKTRKTQGARWAR